MKKKMIAGLVVLVAIALLTWSAKALTTQDGSPQSASQTMSDGGTAATGGSGTDTSATGGAGNEATSGYKDGTYTANGSYQSPGGTESVGVSITLTDGVVTASSVEEGATSAEAREYQEDFISTYRSFVTGKKIDDIRLSRVSGSSLTSIGFNNALETIKDQAKS